MLLYREFCSLCAHCQLKSLESCWLSKAYILQVMSTLLVGNRLERQLLVQLFSLEKKKRSNFLTHLSHLKTKKCWSTNVTLALIQSFYEATMNISVCRTVLLHLQRFLTPLNVCMQCTWSQFEIKTCLVNVHIIHPDHHAARLQPLQDWI